jgi:two-component system response regulator AtoC
MNILIVDDEKIKRVTLKEDLEDAGYDAFTASSGDETLELLKKEGFEIVVTDLRMQQMDGIELLKKVKADYPDIYVIMMTAYATVETAVEAMKLGAYDYITKPFSSDELLLILDRIKRLKSLEEENRDLRLKLKTDYRYDQLIGESPAMQKVFEKVEKALSSNLTMLLQGETGTGKDIIASIVHYNGNRKDHPFIKLSCAAIPHELIESEIFGYEKGAFTGAVKQKKGRIEMADKGTIFLDEVDDIPLELQVKLLRFLDEKTLERVGGTSSIKVDVRIIAATKIDLRNKAERGEFREDLYYRLNVFPITLPPLRERKEDITLLIDHFLQKSFPHNDMPGIAPECLDVLMGYHWPGNIRELKHLIERLSLLKVGSSIKLTDLPHEMRLPAANGKRLEPGKYSFEEVISSAERELITSALQMAGGNKSKAAEILKMKPSTFRDKLKNIR